MACVRCGKKRHVNKDSPKMAPLMTLRSTGWSGLKRYLQPKMLNLL